MTTPKTSATKVVSTKYGSLPSYIAAYLSGGGMVQRYAGGGLSAHVYRGLKSKPLGSDTIPAMLTQGEFVVRRPAVQAIGKDNLERMNRTATYGDGSVYNYNLSVNVRSEADPDRIARTVMRQIQRVDAQKVRGNRI